MSRLEELYKTMCEESPYGFHPSIKKYILELAEIYAKECSQASLVKASENAVAYKLKSNNSIKAIVEAESITNHENIILL